MDAVIHTDWVVFFFFLQGSRQTVEMMRCSSDSQSCGALYSVVRFGSVSARLNSESCLESRSSIPKVWVKNSLWLKSMIP